MQVKQLHVRESSCARLSEAINAYANDAKRTEQSALRDFARGGFYIHGEGEKDFGPHGSDEAQNNSGEAIDAYSGHNELLAEHLKQSGGQAMLGYVEELLWNIIPDGVQPSDVIAISIDKDKQVHYVTDDKGNKHAYIYMGVKSITVLNPNPRKYYLNENGQLTQNPQGVPTGYMAELRAKVKLKTTQGMSSFMNREGKIVVRFDSISYEVEKLDIGLNHPRLNYHAEVATNIVEKNNVDQDISHTEIGYKVIPNRTRNLPRIFAGVATGLIAATGVGLFVIAGFAIANKGFKNAFDKFTTNIQNTVFKNFKYPLARKFKNSLKRMMPNVYTNNAEITKTVEALLKPENKVEIAQKVEGEANIDGTYAMDSLKSGEESPSFATADLESGTESELEGESSEEEAKLDIPSDDEWIDVPLDDDAKNTPN